MTDMKKLGDAELEVMLSLWSFHEPVTSTILLKSLRGKRDWALPTLMTVLSRLADKGFIVCDRSTRTNMYSPLINEQSYKTQESRLFFHKLHGNSISGLVSSLYDGGAIDNDDIEELKRFIDDVGVKK